ncbi:hypothetical protein P171DRAFT_525793 [Karstenula rhodostoma CBS 690.94]|uniref:Glycosyl transferase CAP10 domain-containing protein n=1 Tax=Karstenula rhodostoma CBS 690.94 TaxID=1392251 RepID=A0A9P4P8Y5_9PLEO|nr:hypothetical protein P171DRAFT_525793 [Karstenula rhodostoma CBS 690.94]
MILRRRCGASDCLAWFFISGIALVFFLVCSILYGTRTENPSLPGVVQEVLPAGRCLCQQSTTFHCESCLDCAARPAVAIAGNATQAPETWEFDYRRDATNYGLDEDQCAAAFPGLFEDVERAKNFRRGRGLVTQKNLTDFALTKGMVRAMIHDGQLYVLQTFLVDNINRQKAVASLAALHRALSAARDRPAIPNAEFVLSVEDLPAHPEKPLWMLARRAQDQDLWLMPDFGWWSWDMPSLGALDDVAAEALQREQLVPWDAKKQKLVWRGKLNFSPKLRRALVEAAKGKPWSDVGQVTWEDTDFKEPGAHFLGPVDQCEYMFIAHAEGRSYSGALKYRQLCRSVVVSHKLQWIQHYHYLLLASGAKQNYVEVERDFSDLSSTMDDLLAHPEKAKRIADNSVKTFRERYMTGAAEACYWRALVKAWKEVSFEPSAYEEVADGQKKVRRKKRGVRYETFIVYDYDSQITFPKIAQ